MTAKKTIPFLKSGDEIRIVAPASVVEKRYVKNTVTSLKSLGFKVSLGEHLFSVFNQFAGDDEHRQGDFQSALDDENVRAVFCARGGYGSVRIFNRISYEVFKKNPKWLVGFSDVTIFHVFLNQQLGFPSVHAPMPVNYSSEYFQENLQRLDAILRGRNDGISVNPNPLNIEGKCRAEVVGGNLSILYSLQGTPYEIITDGKILFIEDVGEQLYHLDRIMQNLSLSSKLRKLKGLVVGAFSDMKDKKRPFGRTAGEIVRSYVEGNGIPVAFGFPAGHIENNEPFILGREAELSVTAEGAFLNYGM
ncbi:MAG: LD-carboxypeptidase [Bacteroidales bacterium]|nr:LD-carboxypeptidase [Bacteroidales bacterium]